MQNYAHLSDNNKNNDKGKHLNNGARVQKDNGKVSCANNKIGHVYCSSIICQKQKMTLSFANYVEPVANYIHRRNDVTHTIENVNKYPAVIG